MTFSWPRAVAAITASAILTTYFAGDLLLYIAIVLILFVLAPGGH